MLDLFNIATPQNCDIQTFYGPTRNSFAQQYSWIKPRGISHVYMMLIGAGGAPRTGSAGGGSGAVTVWYGSAINVPDNLIVNPAFGSTSGSNTTVRANSSTGVITLLTANGGSSATGGTATAANTFAASGFYQSIAGQNGSTGDPGPSSTTFLSGGGISTVTANYGYVSTSGGAGGQRGYFMFQPIIVGVGCSIASDNGGGHFGCGGGASTLNGFGGPGLVLIASW